MARFGNATVAHPSRYLIREAIPREYGDQPPALKAPAVWAASTFGEADMVRDQLIVSLGRYTNPFQFLISTHLLADATSIPENQFRHRLRLMGIEPPRDNHWERWYSVIASSLDDVRLLEVWKLLDKVEPYKIEPSHVHDKLDRTSPTPRMKKAYVVVKMYWQYNDNWHDLGDDEPIKAFADRDAAEVLRLQLEEPERERWRTPFFTNCAVENLTSLSLNQLLQAMGDLVAEEGVPPPTELVDDTWWSGFLKRTSPRIFHKVWDLFDRVRFYQTVEVEVADPPSSEI